MDNDVRFVRTPKLGIESSSDVWQLKKYRGRVGFMPLVEIGLGLYLTAAVLYATVHQIWGLLPFLVLFQLGFLCSGFLSLTQGWQPIKFLGRAQRSLS
jgi:hypothetical protein